MTVEIKLTPEGEKVYRELTRVSGWSLAEIAYVGMCLAELAIPWKAAGRTLMVVDADGIASDVELPPFKSEVDQVLARLEKTL